ncbi:MAG TPA: acyl-ACP--UDP-N-acetylglucosamine O-acyltransferase [Gemmataceae bacterium]|nr:acyl-ACP--UDP-N-acetylglucosamine O-acyltransferase [Gemmataceae bacterium]
MAIAQSARIHPTAIIDPRAEIGQAVEIGSHVVVEGPVRVGDGCVIRPGVHLIGPLTMGRHNHVFSHAVLGERPQHLKYDNEATRVEIGDQNIFREHVTVHRATTASWVTRIGAGNFLMAGAHVAHDCVVGDHCILANGALMGGHCILENNVFLSGNSALHQYVRAGRLSLLSGCSGSTMDIPPFIIQQRINCVVGVNVVGMRRAGIATEHIDAVRRAFHILYLERLVLTAALERIDRELGDVAVVAEMTAFIRASKRGINLLNDRDAA